MSKHEMFIVPELEWVMKMGRKGVNVLILDIETSPLEVYTWGLYKQRINPCNVIKDWAVLSWAAKWLCDSKIHSGVVTPFDATNRDDRTIITALWKLVDEADIIIAHNAKRFDIKKINTRFIVNGLKPPSPYQVIDTLVEARKTFAFSSNKLDYINETLGLQRKLDTNFNLWRRSIEPCAEEQLEALNEMLTYNKSDVTALEELYFMLRPWIKSHPNMAAYIDAPEVMCPACGSNNIKHCGFYHTQVAEYEAFRCECGAICRARISEFSPEKRASLRVSTVR